MTDRYQIIEEGVYTYEPQFPKERQYTPEGLYPRRFWDIITFEDEQSMSRYLAGQENFVADPEPEPMHQCQDCKRPCKVRFKLCYRCYKFREKRLAS